MSVTRFLAAMFLLVALVAFVADATPYLLRSGNFSATSLAGHWQEVAPQTFKSITISLSEGTGAWIWKNVIVHVIALPTFVLFGLLALFAGYVGRRRSRVKVFAN